MKLKTITTIELSSKCNLKCQYCINRYMESRAGRKPQIMSRNVFAMACLILKETVRRGTQREINLNGNGESLLDPDIISRIKTIREIVGKNIKVQMSTNAVLLTPEIAIEIKNAGLDKIHISVHSAYHVRKAVDFLQRINFDFCVNPGTILTSHNWAGQLEPEDNVFILPKAKCDPLLEGRGYIQAEGDIVPCCYDYRNLGKFGTVFDDDLFETEYTKFGLCETCHQMI